MGNNLLRRYKKQGSRWSDPKAKRHKHDFTVPALVVLERANGRTGYYQVMKCRYCHSFQCIPREGTFDGFLRDPDDMDIVPRARMVFQTNHQYNIELKDWKFDREEPVD